MMKNVLNPDFKDFILALNQAGVEYILIGGYAVIYYGYNRTTGDLDIWVNATSANYLKLKKAFSDFGMSMFDMTEERFLNAAYLDVFTFGRPPVCIEIVTAVDGLTFDHAFKRSEWIELSNVNVRIIDIDDLKATKQATNRPKDQDDLNHLN